jgi:hypothetical protein
MRNPVSQTSTITRISGAYHTRSQNAMKYVLFAASAVLIAVLTLASCRTSNTYAPRTAEPIWPAAPAEPADTSYSPASMPDATPTTGLQQSTPPRAQPLAASRVESAAQSTAMAPSSLRLAARLLLFSSSSQTTSR